MLKHESLTFVYVGFSMPYLLHEELSELKVKSYRSESVSVLDDATDIFLTSWYGIFYYSIFYLPPLFPVFIPSI